MPCVYCLGYTQSVINKRAALLVQWSNGWPSNRTDDIGSIFAEGRNYLAQRTTEINERHISHKKSGGDAGF